MPWAVADWQLPHQASTPRLITCHLQQCVHACKQMLRPWRKADDVQCDTRAGCGGDSEAAAKSTDPVCQRHRCHRARESVLHDAPRAVGRGDAFQGQGVHGAYAEGSWR